MSPASQLARAVNGAKPIVVLKFGSSILKTPADLSELVSEVYRLVRAGRRVVAVVSAFAGRTDALLAEANAFGCPHDNINAAAYVATGEETAAAMAALALDRAGICSIALKAADVGIIAQRSWDNAAPTQVEARNILSAFEAHDAVVVPGFIAWDGAGRTVLLGRGGSDLTAVLLGGVLEAERIRLLKDVDGVYDADPALAADAPRYDHITWDRAREIAGKLIQPKALEAAAERNLTIEVGAIGADDVTIVGPRSAPPAKPRAPRKLRVALAGYGVVGGGLAQRLAERPDMFEITQVLVRDLNKPRHVPVSAQAFTDFPGHLINRDNDAIVDVLSCGEAGALLTDAALNAGIHVVSANKQAIVGDYAQLHAASGRSRATLLYSAACGGGAPILEATARASEDGAGIHDIAGVLNGTVNFVLEALAGGASLRDALALAREAGLAEEDPSADLNGADAAAKLKLISFRAFGRDIDDLRLEPLDEAIAARAQAERLRQVARLSLQDGHAIGSIRFEPAEVGPFADLRGDRNAIEITLKDNRVISARGRGAGRWPTTESVYADLIDLHNIVAHAG